MPEMWSAPPWICTRLSVRSFYYRRLFTLLTVDRRKDFVCLWRLVVEKVVLCILLTVSVLDWSVLDWSVKCGVLHTVVDSEHATPTGQFPLELTRSGLPKKTH